jgi:hypothetical protein
VPSLHDARLRFNALGLPDALALPLHGWLAGSDRAALHALAQERADAHLAPLAARLAR